MQGGPKPKPAIQARTAATFIGSCLQIHLLGPVDIPSSGPGCSIARTRFMGSSCVPVGRWWTIRGMDYAEARVAFFQSRSVDAPEPGTTIWRTSARTLRDAIEPIATICFWAEPAFDRYADLGMDFLEGYVWGRACVLGEPAGTVVASAFGVFEPSVVEGLYDAGRSKCSPAAMRAAKEAGAVEALRQVLGEHRGDGHVDAYVAAGLTGLEANLLTELIVGWEPLAYTASRGWSVEAMQAGTDALTSQGLAANGSPTPAGKQLRDEIEATTDRLMQPVIDAMGEDLESLTSTLNTWSQQIVDRGWFPPDPYKRASG